MRYMIFELPNGKQIIFRDALPWMPLNIAAMRSYHAPMRFVGIWRDKDCYRA